MKRSIALAIAVCVVFPAPGFAQTLRGSVAAAPQAPGLNGTAGIVSPVINNSPLLIPSATLLSPTLANGMVTAPTAQSVLPLKAVAVKAVPVAVLPVNPVGTAALKVRPMEAAHVLNSAFLNNDFSALFDGATARPAAAAAETANGRESVPAALKPAAAVRTDLKIPGAEVKAPGASKRLATSALAWWRLSGIIAPLAALLPSIPNAFGMDATAWLAISALWVGSPAVWDAIPPNGSAATPRPPSPRRWWPAPPSAPPPPPSPAGRC
ncbi:MAG: hypothetical protein M0D55_19250 [Elusimicrobiota bacterium]|nr:MAG: hypothetical protein M0D55_19250 [Elusimicrobiota bacterium]